MKLKSFLDRLDHDRIVRAIQAAEARSRGEIRVHASSRAVVDAKKAAAEQFEKLGMVGTAEGTGVLIFVAPRSRNLAVLGDHGIHAKGGDELWHEVAAAMEEDFRAGRFGDGVVKAVERVGEVLAEHFPRQDGVADKDELPNTVTEDSIRPTIPHRVMRLPKSRRGPLLDCRSSGLRVECGISPRSRKRRPSAQTSTSNPG